MAAGPSKVPTKIGCNDSETLRLLNRIQQKLNEESTLAVPKEESYLQRASRLTGICPKSLQILHATPLGDTNVHVPVIDRYVLYTAYTNFCLKERRFPTSNDLYLFLNDKLPPYMDIMGFRKMLIGMAFVWKKVDNGFVVIERPEHTFERHHYLRKLLKYEENDSHIYYIDENYICRNEKSGVRYENVDETAPKQKPLLGIICAMTRAGVHAVDFAEEINDEVFEEFIVDNLLPIIQEESVIIFDNSPHHCVVINEPPTLLSLKIDMMRWLEEHNVPFEVDMSKCELYELAQKFTPTHTPNYKIDNILKSRGHKVLRIPRTIEKLTPATSLRSLIMSNLPEMYVDESDPAKRELYLKTNIRNTMNYAKRLLFQYTRSVHEEARNIFNLDFQMDDTWDILVKNSIESGNEYIDSNFSDSSDEE